MKKILLFSAEVIFLGSTAVPAQATILNVSQGGQIITAPSSVSYNFPGYEHPNFMIGFSEKQNVKLSSNLAIDGGFIAAGQLVSSHMIFLNTPGSRRLACVSCSSSCENESTTVEPLTFRNSNYPP